MSRQRAAILKAAEHALLSVRELTWSPIGGCVEKCGPEGGWVLELTDEEADRRMELTGDGDPFMVGYNAREIIEQIEQLARRRNGRAAAPPAPPEPNTSP